MAATIKCPACGEKNSTELEYCQNCHSRLVPLTGALKGADASLKPGQLPDKKKNTAELEPILPQWLRDAREQARQAPQDDLAQGMEPPRKPQSTPDSSSASPLDLLAGLQSHADDDNDDETPDWLANITGVSNKGKKVPTETADDRRVEMGAREDFARNTSSLENKTPAWLSDIQAQPKSEKDELADWFKAASTSADDSVGLDQPAKSNDSADTISTAALSDDAPDWLRQMQADEVSKNNSTPAVQPFGSNDDSPDWLKGMGSDFPAPATNNPVQAQPAFDSSDDLPSWLQSSAGQPPAADDDTPTWLNNPDSPKASQQPGTSAFAEPAAGADDAPDWLKGMQSESTMPKAVPLKKTAPLWLKDESGAEAEDANVPAWLSPDAPVVNQAPPPSVPEMKQDDAEFGDIPNWLKAAAPQSSIFSEPTVVQEPTFSSDSSDAPDWLAAFKAVEDQPPASPFANEAQDGGNVAAPAFTENSFEGGDNSLFNEMPDWLSNTPVTPVTEPPPVANNADSIAAGQLPSWVQAMRPVEGSISTQASSPSTSDLTIDSSSALSGLTGVLPSVPGYAPSSKPKAYSILLQATEEQKSQALLLEQILSAETEPQPIASYTPLAASRPLRWFIAAVVLIFVTTMLALGTQIFTMPVLSMNSPNELKGALDVAQNVQEGASVLVVMDYHPSHAAELEVAAAPMLDQMDLLRHPKLVFVSTNEMGTILAQRLLSLPSLKDRYRGEGQFTNLGYLPGGELGIRAFTQSPAQTMPSDVFQKPSPLQPNLSVVQFAAVIVLTDNADSGRTWIEQATVATAPIPFPAPIVLITSAQAGPMIQPYYASGQVKGIVNGLYGAAIFEQNNANRPGTARNYWDAYSFGMLFAMLVLVLGGLWNIALGARDRSLAGGQTR